MVMGHTHPTPHIKMSDSAGVKKKRERENESLSYSCSIFFHKILISTSDASD